MTPGAQTVGNIYNLWLCHAIGDLMYGLTCKSDTVISFSVTGFFLLLFCFGGGEAGGKAQLIATWNLLCKYLFI